MNKLTKIALGLCAVKIGIETTKYISGKWGNGKMKKYIEDAQIAVAGAIVELGEEVVKQFGECTKLKEETKRQEQENSRESEKQIIEIIARLTEDNENGKVNKRKLKLSGMLSKLTLLFVAQINRLNSKLV